MVDVNKSETPSLVGLRDAALSVDECIRAVQRPDAGGIAVFLGVVRNHNEGQAVESLEYQAYESMAVKEMAKITDGIRSEIPECRLAVLHRVGALAIGELAVICAASAPHRAEAFRACRLLIDRIKESVPIWKRESGPDRVHWVNWEG